MLWLSSLCFPPLLCSLLTTLFRSPNILHTHAGPGGHSIEDRQAHDTDSCPQGAHSLLGATHSESDNHRRHVVAETEEGKHRIQGAQKQKGLTAWEIREGFLEEMPLKLGLEGRVGVRQVKKGGKGVPGRGNLAHLLPPPHANKNLRNKMSWDQDFGSPSASSSRLRHPPKSRRPLAPDGPPTSQGRFLKDKKQTPESTIHTESAFVMHWLQMTSWKRGTSDSEHRGGRGLSSPHVRPCH